MDLRQLDYFVQIAACGGFNRAAARLHISQSALSRRIQHLEYDLGTSLFERSALGVRLTPAGVVLHRRALALLQQARALKDELRAGDGLIDAEVSIGIPGVLRDALAAPLLARLAERHPRLRMTMTMGMSREIRESLVHGRLDLGVHGVLEPDRALSSVRLFADDLLVVGAPGSVIAGRPVLTPGDVLNLPLVVIGRDALRSLLRLLGSEISFDPARVLEVSDGPLQLELVRQGRYCSILPRVMVEDQIARGDLCGARLPGARYEWRASWSPDHPLPSAADTVLRHLQACATERLVNSNADGLERRAVA